MSRRPKPIDSIGCYSISRARFRGRRFTFDGTTKDLTRQAVSLGAKAGDEVEAVPQLRRGIGAGFRRFAVVFSPLDDRVGGFWCDRIEGAS
jgi:hypothetical protein